MALTLTCDGGCGESLPLDTKPMGQLERCYYCPACRAHVEATEAAVDALRAKVAAAFERASASIRAKGREKVGKLPDA